MTMIAQGAGAAQGTVAGILDMASVPVALQAPGGRLWLLVKDLSEELEDFIRTGAASPNGLHVFPEEQEREMASQWRRLGLAVAYRSQRMECMHRQATITYMQASGPATETSVSLIPWFMRPGRPYPIFVYAYAAWHYRETGGKSMRLSAEAAGRVFGVRMDKSTVCRNIKAMGHLFGASEPGRPLPAEERGALSAEGIAGLVPQVLGGRMPAGWLEEACGGAAGRAPACAGPFAFGGIPHEYSQVFEPGRAAGGKHRDARKRPARPRGSGARRVQRMHLKPASPQLIGQIRLGFIAACRSAALGAAATCHKFLL